MYHMVRICMIVPVKNNVIIKYNWITVTLYRAVPRHLILQRIVLFNTSSVRTRSTTKKNKNHCLENQKGYYLRNRNTGKCSCCNSSQDD